jgi:hypothetical protein
VSALTRFVPEGAGGLDYTATGAENLAHTPFATRLGAAGMTSSLPNLAVFAPVDHY